MIHAVCKESAFSARGRAFAPVLWLALLLGVPTAARAQVPAADQEAMERAKRAAESPMRWIKLQADNAKAAPTSPAPVKPAAPSPRRAVNAAKPNAPVTQGAAAAAAPPSAPEAAAPPVASNPPASAAGQADAGLPKAQEIVTLERVDPQWGDALMQSLRKGRVVVSFEVNAEGQLSRSQVVSSTSSRLDAVALAVLKQWRFQPMDMARSATAEFGFDLTREQASAPEELVLIDQVEPLWDPSLMQTMRQGQVRVRIEVDVDGRLAHAEVVSSSDKRLDPVARAAVRRWRFQPLEQRRAATVEVGFDLDRRTP
jgi:TonB family protein